MKLIENQSFDEERALYGTENVHIKACTFDGPSDGESAIKECKNIIVEDCYWNLRYPFWHVNGLKIIGSELTENCRAALWYSQNIHISDSKLHGIKALRECAQATVEDCSIISPEFGWFVHGITMKNTTMQGEYVLMRSKNLHFDGVELKGKYSFQYIENAVFENCVLDTKDAFWHGKNITIRNSVVKGEYLAWYSENLTFENCKISGTQPFCYCKGLRLVNCELTEADLCFEKSEVEATITTPVVSIKNPLAGRILVPAVGEIIRDDADSKGKIEFF